MCEKSVCFHMSFSKHIRIIYIPIHDFDHKYVRINILYAIDFNWLLWRKHKYIKRNKTLILLFFWVIYSVNYYTDTKLCIICMYLFENRVFISIILILRSNNVGRVIRVYLQCLVALTMICSCDVTGTVYTPIDRGRC